MKKILIISSLLLEIILHSCFFSKNTSVVAATGIYAATIHKLNDVVLENNFSPVVASRNYVYATLAAYSVLATLQPEKYNTLHGQLHDFPYLPTASADEKKEVNLAVSANLAAILIGNAVTFPEGSMMTRYKEVIQLAEQAGLSSTQIEASKIYAQKIADSIMAWSKKDNYALLRSAPKYTITNEDGKWIPTPPMYTSAIEPHWREMRSLTLDSASQFIPPRPPKYNIKNKNSAFIQELNEVKQLGEQLSPEQKHIASFWDDNPFTLQVEGHVMMGRKKYSPSGHWTNIIGLLCRSKETPLEKSIAIYAHACIALFDANISCWDEKYRSERIRPETVINAHVDHAWRPYLQTPAFPAYTSGHSVISNAIAEILTFYFPNTAFTDTTQRSVGIEARTFSSIKQAALEASISRLYGGIHYRSDLSQGNIQGEQVGQWVLKRVTLLK